MPTSKRQYESPRLVQYGDLVTLTKGFPTCPQGSSIHKPLGAGDDTQGAIGNSPWICV